MSEPKSNRPWQIALREDELGLDDVVVKYTVLFRMERLSPDRVWIGCYLAGGQYIHFDLWLEGETIKYEAREPLPDVVYEDAE